MLLRHGETEWSRSGQHTSTTDLDLTEAGEDQARLAALTLRHLALSDPVVFSSPRRRALQTAELAGRTVTEVTPLLAEWNYGDYEGLTTHQIRTDNPGWLLWTHGCPGGESVEQVSARADQAIDLALDQMVDRDVVFVGAAESVTRRNGRRYPIKPAARRLIRCGSDAAESYVDLVFPPDARSFVSAITVGIRLRVQVIAIDGRVPDPLHSAEGPRRRSTEQALRYFEKPGALPR